MKRKQLKLFPPASRDYEFVKELIAATEAPGNVIMSLGSVKESAKSPADRVRLRRLTLGTDPAARFREVVLANLLELLDRLDDGHLIREYAGAAKLNDDEIEHLNLAEHDRIRERVDLLASPLSLQTFSNHRDFIASLRFYVISIQPNDGQVIHCFHTYSETFQLQRSRFIALIQGHGQSYFDEVRSGFLFPSDVDCICRGNDMFIINKEKFQRIFGFYEHVQVDAAEAVKALNMKVPIANISEVIAATERDSRMAIRFADLPRTRAFQRLSMRHLKRVIAEEHLPVLTEMRGEQEMLVFSKSYKSQFIHLLCDDYVEGRVTRLHYEASAKRELPARPARRTAHAGLRVVR